MADDTDFAALYGELGITADLTPEQFRQAYRRRVAQLHPDQRGDEADLVRLQELNRLYGAALEFLRTHGRLPGAPLTARVIAPVEPPASIAPVEPPASIAQPAEPPAFEPAHDPRRETFATHDKAGSHPASRWFTWMAVVAVLVLLVHACREPHEAKDGPTAASTFDTVVEDVLGIDRIRLGMDKTRVEAIQGEPVGKHEQRWDYGPSWIGFKCGGAVSDWYSSPLRPLEVDTPHPTAADWDRHDAAPPAGC